jgi:hypothetical protein
MDMQMKLDDGIIATMFSAGAYSALEGRGMSSKDADAFVSHVCKEAAVGRIDFDDQNNTWWNRNKSWALPLALATGAFVIGGDAGRNGRPDRNYFSNAGSLLWERVKALVGIPDNRLWDANTSEYKGTK